MNKIVSVNTDYEVLTSGFIRRIKDGYCPKPQMRLGYYRISLYDSSKKKSKLYTLHRLIAEAFIPNPENKSQVNHINGIKTDNRIENLEWCTPKENVQHSLLNGLKPKQKMKAHHRAILNECISKKVKDISSNIIYNSATEAAMKLGYKRSTLIHYLIGSRKNKTTLRYI